VRLDPSIINFVKSWCRVYGDGDPGRSRPHAENDLKGMEILWRREEHFENMIDCIVARDALRQIPHQVWGATFGKLDWKVILSRSLNP